jgi:exonuclease III
MWTHKNTGGANPSIQQVDYIFASDELVGEIRLVKGGSADFPDAWDVSDHAPVVVDFR